MKKAVLFTSIVLLFVFAFASMKLTMNSYFEPDRVVSSDMKDKGVLPSPQQPGPIAEEREDQKSGDKLAADGSIGSSDNLTNNDCAGESSFGNNIQENNVTKAMDNDVARPYSPLPDGRIFSREGPPYGYLPTEYEKPNVSLPLLPLEPQG